MVSSIASEAPAQGELDGDGLLDVYVSTYGAVTMRMADYEEMLSPEDIAIIEEECQEVMRPFKYDTLAAQASPS